MKIVVVGTRGIPEIAGGVETHCEKLYPRLARMGHDITVIRRTPYITSKNSMKEFEGVKLVDVYAPKKKSMEAIVHTFLAVIKARKLKPDLVHFHAVGPSLLIPFARLLGMKVVMTNHGPDYDRQKWGRLAKAVIRTGEKWGTRYASRVIVISKVIANILKTNYGRTDSVLIYNGVESPEKATDDSYIRSLGLEPGNYVVGMGRFVEEKGFHDLVDAFTLMNNPGFKLVLVGDSDHPDEYSERLKDKARRAGVVLTGYIKGEKMNQIMSHASLFVMPSYHEGLPIALLEAMSYGLDIAVSDIPACLLPELNVDDFFPVGNVEAIKTIVERKMEAGAPSRKYDLSSYQWDTIARQTENVYKELLSEKK